MKFKPLALLVIRIIIGSLFVWVGIQNLEDLEAFANKIAACEILPIILITPLAITLPVFEILIGVSVIWGLLPE